MPHLLLWTQAPVPAQRRSQTVVVVDFNNRSAIPSPLLGRRAASAMSLQLRQSDTWDPVSQNVVDQKIADLRLRPPFDRVALQSLARAVDAQEVLVGDVTSARVTDHPAQATVRIVVRLVDANSGEMVNGAVETAVASHIGLDAAQDVLLDEALSKAAYQARHTMETYQLPEGTVLNTTVVGTRQDALLNIGTRQGVKAGMQFVVLRGRELVGYLSASSIDPDKTVAVISKNFRGVKPEDNVRAIYALPAGAEAADAPEAQQPRPGDVVVPDVVPPSKAPKSGHGLGGAARVFLGLAAVLGIYALAGHKGGSTTAFSTVAQATQIGGTGTNAAAVRVTWSRPHEIPSNAIVQYQVYRIDPTNAAIPVLIGVSNEANREVIDTAAGGSVTNYYIGTGGDAGSENTTAVTFPGLVPGQQYRYYVQTVYQQGVSFGGDTTTGGTTGTTGGTTTGTTTGTTGSGLLISQPSARTGSATPLVPPVTSAPADQATGVDLTNVTFTWTTTPGADTYSVQVSADPTNPNSYQEVAKYLNPSRTGNLSVSRTVNIAARFAGRTLLAWRVGAKNSSDPKPPVGGYVYSLIQSFSPQ